MDVKCLIIDDEPLAINVIKNYLSQVNDVTLVETFNNAVDGLNFLKNNNVDLIFLDINMPLLDGLSFVKSLETKQPKIIITTAHEEYAVESFELDVLDYLVKPISFPRFLKAMNKVFKVFSEKTAHHVVPERPYIFIKIDKKKLKKIYLDELLVIESLKDYLKITTQTDRFIIHQTLSSFTDQLPADNFIRIHRSYTIAIDKVDTVEGNSIEIAGIRYTIGRTYIDDVKNKILNI